MSFKKQEAELENVHQVPSNFNIHNSNTQKRMS